MAHMLETRVSGEGNALLAYYLRDLQGAQRVTHAEECDLARRAQGGDAAARARLIEVNLPLVIIIARAFRTPQVALIDLIQEGNIGLMHAVEKFDWTRNIRFGTYASWWIRQAVRRAALMQGRLIYLPDRAVAQLHHLRRVAMETMQHTGREATTRELAAACDMTEASVAHLLQYVHEPLSLDAPLYDDEGLSGQEVIIDANVLSAPGSTASSAAHLEELFTVLSPRERCIVELRFGLLDGRCLTQAETGTRMSLSRERIRQIEVSALAKLRRAHQAKLRD